MSSMAFLASRPMEDFFINPTIDRNVKPKLTRTFIADDFDLNEIFPAQGLQQQAVPSSTLPQSDKITTRSSSIISLPQESAASLSFVPDMPDYFHGYASEEEMASPNDGFSLSVPSPDEDYEGAITPGSYLADAIQSCNRAQAVRIQPVGKARVVVLPKLDLSYRRTDRPSPTFNEGRRGSRLMSIQESQSARTSQDSNLHSHSRNTSESSSTAGSPASTAPSSVDENELSHIYRHNSKKGSQRHVPLMEAVKAMTPALETFDQHMKSNTLPRRSNEPDYRRYSTDLSSRFNEPTPASPSGSFRPSIRKMAKFSSIINLNLLGRDSKDSSGSSSSSSIYHDATSTLNDAPSVSNTVSSPRPSQSSHSRTSSLRLVARGANERAPTMSLPPFPGA